MKQEHSRIREIVKQLGEKQFNDHTRPIRYTKGFDDILEYIEQQERKDAALIEKALTTDKTLEIVKKHKQAVCGFPSKEAVIIYHELCDILRESEATK